VPYYFESAYYWYQVKKVGLVPARSIKPYSMQAVRQVVSSGVLIVGRLDVDGQSFAPIGLHKYTLPLIGYSQNGSALV
jgi:hypothetical protein